MELKSYRESLYSMVAEAVFGSDFEKIRKGRTREYGRKSLFEMIELEDFRGSP